MGHCNHHHAPPPPPPHVYRPRGYYMYGNTFFDPPLAFYNTSRCHKGPYYDTNIIRPKWNNGIYEDWEPFVVSPEINCNDCGCKHPINRNAYLANIINIQTKLVHTLDMTFYSADGKSDRSITLVVGRRYAVTFITESGYNTAVGVLKLIDSNIPTTEMTYIGNYNAVSTQAYIGMDCSTTGNSDKKKIYISSIRFIQEIEDEEDYDPINPPEEEPSDSEKLDMILDALKKMKKCACGIDPDTLGTTPDGKPILDGTADDHMGVPDPENPCVYGKILDALKDLQEHFSKCECGCNKEDMESEMLKNLQVKTDKVDPQGKV